MPYPVSMSIDYLDNAKLRNCIFPFRNTCDKEREKLYLCIRLNNSTFGS